MTMRDFSERVGTATFEANDLRAAGDTVLAEIVQRGERKASGIGVSKPLLSCSSPSVAERSCGMRASRTKPEALEAAGLSE